MDYIFPTVTGNDKQFNSFSLGNFNIIFNGFLWNGIRNNDFCELYIWTAYEKKQGGANMDQPIIEVEHITKTYGTATVLNDVSVSFNRGTVTGIIGRNGSGKTVLLKCILGLTPVTSGNITVNGRRVGKEIDFPDSIGFIVNTPGFLPGYSGYANMKFLAAINSKAKKDDIIRAMETVGLEPSNRKKVGEYSLGMKQRLAIAQAIMEDPQILVLDEPMNSLDNSGVVEMRRLFSGMAQQGKTILITSHNHEDIEVLCDVVYEMDHGSLKREGD